MWARLGIMVVTWCAGLGWIHNRCMMGLVTGKCIKFWKVVRPACDCSVSIRQQTLEVWPDPGFRLRQTDVSVDLSE